MESSNSFSRFDAHTRAFFATLASAAEGASAIFMERPTVAQVRVSDITADDWGVRLRITCLPKPGFGRLGRKAVESTVLAAAWEVFSPEPDAWYAHYISWRLLFDPKLIARISAFAERLASAGQQISYEQALVCTQQHELKTSAIDDSGH